MRMEMVDGKDRAATRAATSTFDLSKDDVKGMAIDELDPISLIGYFQICCITKCKVKQTTRNYVIIRYIKCTVIDLKINSIFRRSQRKSGR